MRRGAAGPAKRPSSRLVVREHKHGCTSQRAVARRGGQGHPDAGCAVVTVSASVSGIRCPVSGASVRCPRAPVHATGVRCGRLSVQVSSVRRPCVPASAVSDGNEVAGCGGGAGRRTAGMAGVGAVTRHVHDGTSSARGWSLALEAGAGRAGPAEGRLGLGRRRGRWLAVGQADRVADRERGWMRAGSPIERQLAVTTLRGHCVRPGPGLAGL
jgi:hypothetical protein